jgi:hypothetical protein
MALTQECLQNYVAYYACKIANLSDKYETALSIGSTCAENYLFQLEVAITLNEILCSINLEEESCLTDAQICELIDKLKYIIKNPCNC